MGKYRVTLKPPKGHQIPSLLRSFGHWLAEQENGTLGRFDLLAEKVPKEWNPEAAKRLQRDGFSFLTMPDGSLLVLLQTGAKGPAAVVLLGSEGETETVASSLEEFLLLLGKGETGLDDLDDEDAGGRDKLRTWLRQEKVRAPKAAPFDFNAYLDGVPAGPSAAPPPRVDSRAAPIPAAITSFPPLLRRLVMLVGRRADDPALVDFVTKTLGKKVPGSMTDFGDSSKNVVANKQAIEMAFAHDVTNEKYPLIPKSKNSYVPYLTIVWIKEKFPEPLPFGLNLDMTEEELTSALGPPGEIGFGGARRPYWQRVLDSQQDIVLSVEEASIALTVRENLALVPRTSRGWKLLGLFVAWAILRSLLDETRFGAHASLLAAVRKSEKTGREFIEAALPRGLWDIHLKDKPGLRRLCYCWFNNLDGVFIETDLIPVFGTRKDSYGIKNLKVDDDNWEAVDKAAPAFDKRFADWIKAEKKRR